MPQVVSIGCEGGGPETKLVCQAKVPLAQALERRVAMPRSKAIDQYALVLRIGGSIQEYGEEGLANLRLFKSRRFITVDIQVPARVWQPLSASELRKYIARKVMSALEACIIRLEREGPIERQLLLEPVQEAIDEYLGAEKGDA